MPFRSATSNVGVSDTPNSLAPSGLSLGDLLIAAVSNGGGSGVSISAPSGWTLINRSNNGTNLAFATYYRIAGSSEPSSYSWSTDTPSGTWSVSIAAYSEINNTSPIIRTSTPEISGSVTTTYNRPTAAAADSTDVYVTLMGMRNAAVRTVSPVSNAIERVESSQDNTTNVFKTHIQDEPGSASATAKTGNFSGNQQYKILVGVMLKSLTVVGPLARTDFPREGYTPTRLAPQSVRVGSLARFDNIRVFYDPALRLSPVTLRPALYENSREVYTPRINTSGIPFLDRTWTYYPVAVNAGVHETGVIEFLNRTHEVYAPSVRLTATVLKPVRYDAQRTSYDPAGIRTGSVKVGPTARLDYGRAVYSPQLKLGAVRISPGEPPASLIEAYGVRINPELTNEAARVQSNRIRGLALSGYRGVLHYEPRLFLSNIYGDELAELPGVTGASVNLSNYRDNTWEVALEAGATDAFDPVRDYVMCALDVRAGRDPVERYPLGLYRFEFPAGQDEPTGSAWSLTGESLETLLMRGMATGGYRVAPGAGVLSSVRSLLTARGIPASRITFPGASEEKTLPNGLYFDPVTDEEGAYFIRIANSLLAAGGFGALQTDARGQFTTSKIVSLEEKNPNVLYATRDAQENAHLPADDMLIAQPIPRQPSYDRFANEVFVSSQDVNQEPAITATARNENPNSPVSIQNLGYTVTKTVQMETIPDQATANQVARAELARATAFHLVRDIVTMPDPRRGPDEAYRVIATNSRNKRVMDGKWLVTGWELELSEEPGEMRHQVSRSESFV